ncbi:MAG TPA: class I SAM-dependent methyltransferase [Nitrospiraceae bacterium]|nr:class I SAM-dependent methyltransferase [Nitrospiraceae bacterium]
MLELKKNRVESGDCAPPDAQAVSQWSGQARERAVQRMFTAIARWYDVNNTVLSFGLHWRWKRTAEALVPPLQHGWAVDIGAGTGDLALLLAGRYGKSGHVVGLDLNDAMLREGSRKIRQAGFRAQITALRGNGESLGFRDESFDAATAGFCMRNVGNLNQALGEIRRVLKPGGRFVCLEFSRPVHGGLRRLYDWYSFRVLPWIGTKVAGDDTGVYEYLPASIRAFPDQERLSRLMRDAGFRSVEYRNLSGGIVAIHVAIK